ncbi:MAG: hypothetical protein V4691_02720 [Pseudomonadota bacterium]
MKAEFVKNYLPLPQDQTWNAFKSTLSEVSNLEGDMADWILKASPQDLERLSQKEKLQRLYYLATAPNLENDKRENCLRKIYAVLSFSKTRTKNYQTNVTQFCKDILPRANNWYDMWEKYSAAEKKEKAEQFIAAQMDVFLGRGAVLPQIEFVPASKEYPERTTLYNSDGKQHSIKVYDPEGISFAAFFKSLFRSGIQHMQNMETPDKNLTKIGEKLSGDTRFDSDNVLLSMSMDKACYLRDDSKASLNPTINKDSLNPATQEVKALGNMFDATLMLTPKTVKV